MFRFVVLLAFVNCAFAGAIPADGEGRIVNGVNTTIQAHPYQVSLQTNTGIHFCGGSIIDKNTIVTACHCMQSYSASQFKVRLGSTEWNTGGEVVAVRAYKCHNDYNPHTMVNDVAVIKLISEVNETSNIRYIELAENTPATGTHAVVTGWGTKCYPTCVSLSNVLQEVEVEIVGGPECGSSNFKYGSIIGEGNVCAYAVGKGVCQGDSGGPLVANNKLVGVVSWGKGCTVDSYPSVYSEVSYYFSWIQTESNVL